MKPKKAISGAITYLEQFRNSKKYLMLAGIKLEAIKLQLILFISAGVLDLFILIYTIARVASVYGISASFVIIFTLFIIITLSQIASTSCIICVDNNTVFSFPISEINFRISTIWFGSSPDVGSSNINTFGS